MAQMPYLFVYLFVFLSFIYSWPLIAQPISGAPTLNDEEVASYRLLSPLINDLGRCQIDETLRKFKSIAAANKHLPRTYFLKCNAAYNRLKQVCLKEFGPKDGVLAFERAETSSSGVFYSYFRLSSYEKWPEKLGNYFQNEHRLDYLAGIQSFCIEKTYPRVACEYRSTPDILSRVVMSICSTTDKERTSVMAKQFSLMEREAKSKIEAINEKLESDLKYRIRLILGGLTRLEMMSLDDSFDIPRADLNSEGSNKNSSEKYCKLPSWWRKNI